MTLSQNINLLLSKFFISQDPKAKAFNSFYRELLQSDVYEKLAFKIQGHPTKAYNLLTKENYSFLKEWLKSEEIQSILDYGCGLGPTSDLIEGRPDILLTGCDFSKAAIAHNQLKYPNHCFLTFHHNLKLHHHCDSVVCLDSLYHGFDQGRSVEDNLLKLLNPVTKRIILIQNFSNATPPILSARWKVNIMDITSSFCQLVEDWNQELLSTEVQEDREKYPLLWGTITREFRHHQTSLEKGFVKRFVATYEKS
ncbi:MAG: class I SAM-dependent methyltransferase [Bacteriovoracaceae bacterium]|nr:class I SAM-dependent methyltransferase [Bacteriovoracaceae bacterium]